MSEQQVIQPAENPPVQVANEEENINKGRAYGDEKEGYVEGISMRREFWPKAAPGQEVWTREEMALTRKPGIRQRMTKVWYAATQQWWMQVGTSLHYTNSQDSASIYAVAHALSSAAVDNLFYLITLPEGHRCIFDSYVPKQLADFIKVAPGNSTYRTLLEGFLHAPIPPDKITFEQVSDWVCRNFPKTEEEPQLKKQATPNELVISSNVYGSDQVMGRCRFSGTRTGQGRFNMTRSELIALAQEYEPDEYRDFISALRDRVREWFDQNVGLYLGDDIEYTGHVDEDSDGVEIDQSNISSDLVLRALRAHFPNHFNETRPPTGTDTAF